MEERRRYPRITINEPGKITIPPSPIAIDCMVLDFSPKGARLEVAVGLEFPDRFNLRLEGDGITRGCRVVWRRENRLGVEFG